MFLFYGYRAPRRRVRYIYIYTRTQLATSVKGKREKEAIVSAAFGQQAGKLYEVLSATSSFHFTGRRLLLREFKRRERPIQSGGSLSTIFLRPFRFLLCSSLCLSLSATDLSFYQRRSAKLSNFISFPFLFMFFFILLVHSSEGIMFFLLILIK